MHKPVFDRTCDCIVNHVCFFLCLLSEEIEILELNTALLTTYFISYLKHPIIYLLTYFAKLFACSLPIGVKQ